VKVEVGAAKLGLKLHEHEKRHNGAAVAGK